MEPGIPSCARALRMATPSSTTVSSELSGKPVLPLVVHIMVGSSGSMDASGSGH